jgi:hypothetical protein
MMKKKMRMRMMMIWLGRKRRKGVELQKTLRRM